VLSRPTQPASPSGLADSGQGRPCGVSDSSTGLDHFNQPTSPLRFPPVTAAGEGLLAVIKEFASGIGLDQTQSP
jgi:hypothetical protein